MMRGKIITMRDHLDRSGDGRRWLWALMHEDEGMVCDTVHRSETREDAIEHARECARAILDAIESGHVK